MRLQGKIAIVTGGASGIGSAIARRYAKEGATVVIVDIADGQPIVADITNAGGSAQYVAADLRKVSECARAVKAVASAFGTVDILVNSAGIFIGIDIESAVEDDWNHMIDVDAKAPFFLSQAVLPYMKRAGGGKIINITSACDYLALPGCAIYSAAKSALHALTRCLMVEMAPYRINVNAIAPGNTKTPLNASLREISGYVDRWAKLTPTGQAFLEPEDLTGTAVFLASDDAAHIHGQQFHVDDGLGIALPAAAISLEQREHDGRKTV